MTRKPHSEQEMPCSLHLRILAVMVVAALAATQIVSAQTASPKQVKREIAIMTGILETTLRFAVEESSSPPATPVSAYTVVVRTYFARTGSSTSRGYYLEGQGAVFVLKWASLSEVQGDYGYTKVVVDRDSPQLPKKIKELMKDLEKRQLEVKERISQQQARADKVTELLVEALAYHGDSMTFLAEDEYLNLIIEPASEFGVFGGSAFADGQSAPAATQIITVQKSQVSDYKAGRLTLAEFKSQVLEY